MIARLDLNQYEGDGNVFQDVSLLVNKMLYPVPSKNAEIGFKEAEKCNSSRCNYSGLLL